MPIRTANRLNYFQFDTFDALPVQHAIFTREGGVSPMPWHSLNVGETVGDDAERVKVNRERVFRALGRDPDTLHDTWQVHSANYVLVQQPRGDNPIVKADILLTANPDVTLFMRFADCVPIMLIDPELQVIALAHAGWLGTLRGAAHAAVNAMVERFGTHVGDIHAGLGPSIGPDHYEVGLEVLEQFNKAFPNQADDHFQHHEGRLYLDLWSANEFQLRSMGIEHIDIAGVCTACNLKHWFSHRVEDGRTGRFGALLALEG